MNDDIEPLLKWLHKETLWRAAMASLWNACRRSIPGEDESEEPYDWAYEGDNPPISRDESRRLAPALDEAVRKAADAYELPEYLLRILDDEINAAARRLIAGLPEEQRDKLLGAMKAANREPGGMDGQSGEEPDVEQPLQERFLRLADEWKSGTAGLSSPRAIAGHLAYQKIIAIGEPVLPLNLPRPEEQRRMVVSGVANSDRGKSGTGASQRRAAAERCSLAALGARKRLHPG